MPPLPTEQPEEKHISKSLVITGIIVVLLISSTFIPARWFGIKSSTYKNKPLDLSIITSPSEVAKDTNGDGKISWKEVIDQNFNTRDDAQNATSTTQTDPKILAMLNDPNNLTASFYKSLLVAGTYLKKNGVADRDTEQAVLDNLASQAASLIIPTTYSYKDLNVIKEETKDSISIYGNTLATFLQAMTTKKIMIDDMGAMSSYEQTKNPSDLTGIIKNKQRLDVLLEKIKAVPVPISAVFYHLMILNRIALYRDTLDNFSKAETDPLRAQIAINRYAQVLILLLSTPNQVSQYFNTKNIAFSTKEAGYMFTSGYTIK